MNTHAEKTQENKSQSVANAVTQKQGGGESTFQFVDNRPETIAQRKLQEIADNSPQVKQFQAIRKMANNSPVIQLVKNWNPVSMSWEEDWVPPIGVKMNNPSNTGGSSSSSSSSSIPAMPLAPHTGTSSSSSSSSSALPPMHQNPWDSPDGTRRAMSPGGSIYRQGSPRGNTGRVSKKTGKFKPTSRRSAAGYENPKHSHTNMLPLWERAAITPIPPILTDRKKRKLLMSKGMKFQATDPHGNPTKIIERPEGVLGHAESAGSNFNREGHKRRKKSNTEHNRLTSTFHGIEDRQSSDASGHTEARFESPGPHRGSDPTWYNRHVPRYTGGPWHRWSPDSSAALPSSSPLGMPPLVLPPPAVSLAPHTGASSSSSSSSSIPAMSLAPYTGTSSSSSSGTPESEQAKEEDSLNGDS